MPCIYRLSLQRHRKQVVFFVIDENRVMAMCCLFSNVVPGVSGTLVKLIFKWNVKAEMPHYFDISVYSKISAIYL